MRFLPENDKKELMTELRTFVSKARSYESL